MVRSAARRVTSFTLAAALATFCATEVAAQSSTTRGFLVGAHFGGAALKPQNNDRANAGGGGVRIGYGVNRSLTLFFQGDGASFDVEGEIDDLIGTWAMAHADLGARFNFANSLRRWVPYLQGSVTARVVNVTDIPAGNPYSGQEVSFSGAAVTFGGGVMFYTSGSFAIDAGLLFSGGKFTEITAGNTTVSGLDIEAQSSRFNLGVSWWP